VNGDAAPAVDICVCTHRRPQVMDTLRSLARLELKPGRAIRVIVADNDDVPTAHEKIEATARATGLNLIYIHAPAHNISVARNACLDAATAPLLAFIDDDETAAPGWLEALIATMEREQAAAVLGPVQALYDPAHPAWMQKGDFHSIGPVWVGGEIITGYAGNLLLRRDAPSLRDLRFREALGRSGGEDTLFLASLHHAGGKIAFAPDAVVAEKVAPERARWRWLLQRHFRSGQTHGLLLLERDGGRFLQRARHIALAAGKACYCLAMVPLQSLNTPKVASWFLRGIMHLGVVARLCGIREPIQYGNAA